MQGIYRITCYYSGRSYVGSATVISRRWATHKWALRRGSHHSKYLQHAWNKYGENSFEFSITEIVESQVGLREREQYWIGILHAQAPQGYNMFPVAGSPYGYKHTQQARLNMGFSKRGKIKTEEARAKISATKRAQHKKHTAESIAKMSAVKKARFAARKLNESANNYHTSRADVDH